MSVQFWSSEETDVQLCYSIEPKANLTPDFPEVPLVVKDSREKNTEEDKKTAKKKIKIMETIVDIKEGNIEGRTTNYFLNDKATIDKLIAAARNDDIEVEHNDGSKNIFFSTGSYVTTVVPLVKAWIDLEGDTINEDHVDGLRIKVVKVETVKEKGTKIVGYLVKLNVEGKSVTIHLYDTTLSMLIQAGPTILDPTA